METAKHEDRRVRQALRRFGGTSALWQADEVEFRSADLEIIFGDCFLGEYRTALVGGGEEPLYLPSSDPARSPHRIVYREDYFASALHEVAHWCLAGAERRGLEDYGYWYAPDGRGAEQQARFEKAESRPQALEWIFSDTCRFDFHMSADNLDGGVGPSGGFARAVELEKRKFLDGALPPRAERFRSALQGRRFAGQNGQFPAGFG
jgi:elongation factor P hydroxylase